MVQESNKIYTALDTAVVQLISLQSIGDLNLLFGLLGWVNSVLSVTGISLVRLQSSITEKCMDLHVNGSRTLLLLWRIWNHCLKVEIYMRKVNLVSNEQRAPQSFLSHDIRFVY